MQGDLIRRSAVLKILSDEFDMAAEERAEADNEKDRAFNAGEIHCARRSTRKVKELPAVDAVPVVHARWIPIKLYGEDHAIKCSACNNCDNPSKVPGRYCWQCGARMDAEEDR